MQSHYNVFNALADVRYLFITVGAMAVMPDIHCKILRVTYDKIALIGRLKHWRSSDQV